MRRGALTAAGRGRAVATCSTDARSRASRPGRWRADSGCASKHQVVEDGAMPEAQRAQRIGFLGLGIMGSRMAANVARAGFELTVWTHTPGKAERWAQEHEALVVQTPAHVAARSEIVVSMLVDGDQVAATLLGPEGVASGAS